MTQDDVNPMRDGLSRRAFVGRSGRLLGAAGLLGGTGTLLAACGNDKSSASGGSAAPAALITRPKIASSTSVLPMFIHQLAGPVLYGSQFGLKMTLDDILQFDSHSVAIQTALSKKADVISGSIFGSMAAISQGLPIKIFALTRNRDDNVLAGAGKAQTFDDIFKDGVRVSSDSKGGSSSAELQAIINLTKSGTTVSSLPGYTVLESSGQRQAALAAGQVDAAMMHIDQFWAVQKQKPQAKILAKSVDVPVYPINAFAALTPWLDTNQATAIALAKSVTAACSAFTQDYAEYSTAVKKLVSEPPADDVLKKLWDFAVQNKIWPTDPVLTEAAYGLSAGLAKTAEIFIKEPAYSKAVDTRAMTAAKA
ncbi:MAG: hypothetical protein JWO02_1451 [Solirubrobacterales bacterium]|nr:hypothetical protein [Solirubrobacterales bacterium]